jgi:hypothetical protein
MAVNTYEVNVRCRLQNATVLDPTLVSSVTSSTVVFDAITINGTERDLRDMSTAEKTLLATNFKQMVTDAIDFPTFTQTGPTGGTGNGTMTNVSVSPSIAVSETWTITSTSSTNFTVSGSVSGAGAAAVLPAGTVGSTVTYSHATVDSKGRPLVSFTLTAGSVAFNTGAPTVFTIPVTGNQ